MLPSSSGHAALAPSLAVAGSAVMWGLWWIPIRALDARGLSGDWASVALFACAVLMMAPIAWARRNRLQGSGMAALAVGAMFGATLVAWNHALIMGDVVRVTLLFYLAPVWGTILGFLMLGYRPNAVRLLTILMGLGGAAVMLGFEGGLPLPRSLAEWMGLTSGILFALGAAWTHKTGRTGDVERTFATFALATLFAVLLAIVAPVSHPPQPTDILGALPLLFGVTGLWYVPITWLLIWGAARLDPGRVSILLLLEVGVAVASASLLTDEPFGWREAVGGVLIVGAGALEYYDELSRTAPRC